MKKAQTATVSLKTYFPNKVEQDMEIKVGPGSPVPYIKIGSGEYKTITSKNVVFKGDYSYRDHGGAIDISLTIDQNSPNCTYSANGISHDGTYSIHGRFLYIHFSMPEGDHVMKIEKAHGGTLFLPDTKVDGIRLFMLIRPE